MIRQTYEVFADFFSFYLQDEFVEPFSYRWDIPGVYDRFVDTALGVVAVATVRNMVVPVTIDVFDAEPDLNFSEQDHIVECSVMFPTGRVIVTGNEWLPGESRLIVAPGKYKVRIHLYDLDSLSEDGLDGDDRYHLEIWPTESMDDVVVHRQYVWPELDLTL